MAEQQNPFAMVEGLGGVAAANNLDSASFSGSYIDPEDEKRANEINARNQAMYDEAVGVAYANYESQQAQNQYALDRNAVTRSQPGVAEGRQALAGHWNAQRILPVTTPTLTLPKPPELVNPKSFYKNFAETT